MRNRPFTSIAVAAMAATSLVGAGCSGKDSSSGSQWPPASPRTCRFGDARPTRASHRTVHRVRMDFAKTTS
jgi:hypothetical protein